MLFIKLFQNEITIIAFEIVGYHNNFIHSFIISKGMNPMKEFLHAFFTCKGTAGLLYGFQCLDAPQCQSTQRWFFLVIVIIIDGLMEAFMLKNVYLF